MRAVLLVIGISLLIASLFELFSEARILEEEFQRQNSEIRSLFKEESKCDMTIRMDGDLKKLH